MKTGENVFVYGTLKSGHGANKWFMQGRSEFVRNDRISAKLFDLGAFPAIKTLAKAEEWGADSTVPFISEGPTVTGELYRITDDSLPGRLDSYEGYPDYYDRVEFKTEGGERAWAYVFKDDIDEKKLVGSGCWG